MILEKDVGSGCPTETAVAPCLEEEAVLSCETQLQEPWDVLWQSYSQDTISC